VILIPFKKITKRSSDSKTVMKMWMGKFVPRVKLFITSGSLKGIWLLCRIPAMTKVSVEYLDIR
jgi:hypothetical protein